MSPGPWLVTLLMATALMLLFALGTTLLRKGRTEDEARAYLAGVRYVLLDDPDGAIAELSKAARLNTETYETYFALAELFRRKGELNRAIQLNRNILLRPGVAVDVRHRAQLELAMDLKRAGLKDQAVETFEKLLLDRPAPSDVLVKYRQLLEELGRLPRAIELQEELVKRDDGERKVLANLLAEYARDPSLRPEEALRTAERAVAADQGSANAQLALAEGLLAAGRKADAQRALKAALTLEPERTPRSLVLLGRAMDSPAAVEAWLQREREARADGSAPCELALALWHKQTGDADGALEELRKLVSRHPEDWEARRELGALLLTQNRAEELRRAYEEMLGTMGQPALAFVCRGCAQRLNEHSFRCPVCGAWDAVQRQAPARA